MLVYLVAILVGKGGEVKFFAGSDLFNGKEPIVGMHAPGFVEPFFVHRERRILNEVGQRRYSRAIILKQYRLKQHGAYVFLVVVNNPVGKQCVYRLGDGVLVERLQNKKVGNLFAQRFSSPGGVARSAEAATEAGFSFRAGAESIVCEC